MDTEMETGTETEMDAESEIGTTEPVQPIEPLRSRISVRSLVVPVLSGLLVVALVTVAALGYRVLQSRAVEQTRSSAMATAKSAASDVLSYDYRHLDRDFKAAQAHLTGKFAQDYAQTAKSVVRPTALKIHAVVAAEVRGASVVSGTPDRVVVLLFVNQTTTSNLRKEARTPDQNRVRMTLERVGDKWLVGKVEGL